MPINYKDLYGVETLDVQRKNNYALVISDLTSSIGTMMLYLKTFPFPKTGNVIKQVRTGNAVAYYAGSQDATENVSLSFREFLDRKTSSTLVAWRNAVTSYGSGHVALTKAYKKEGALYKLPPGNASLSSGFKDNEGQKWTLKGCWLADYKEEDYDQENDGDVVIVTGTLVIDRIVMASVGAVGSATAATIDGSKAPTVLS